MIHDRAERLSAPQRNDEIFVIKADYLWRESRQRVGRGEEEEIVSSLHVVSLRHFLILDDSVEEIKIDINGNWILKIRFVSFPFFSPPPHHRTAPLSSPKRVLVMWIGYFPSPPPASSPLFFNSSGRYNSMTQSPNIHAWSGLMLCNIILWQKLEYLFAKYPQKLVGFTAKSSAQNLSPESWMACHSGN